MAVIAGGYPVVFYDATTLDSGGWVNVEAIGERCIDNADNRFVNTAITNGDVPDILQQVERDDFKTLRRHFIDVESVFEIHRHERPSISMNAQWADVPMQGSAYDLHSSRNSATN